MMTTPRILGLAASAWVALVGCTAPSAPAVSPCFEGDLSPCACPGALPSLALCRDGRYEACDCVPCDPFGMEACACGDGSSGTLDCGPDGRALCSCEQNWSFCIPGERYGCLCASGRAGTQTCGTSLLGSCVCDGEPVLDAGTTNGEIADAFVSEAPDAAWPPGCAPTACDGHCGLRETSCGIPFDCGPCHSTLWQRTIVARELVWDPIRALLYVATTEGDPTHPNSLVGIDPVTEEEVFALPVGSEAFSLTFSEDGASLYAMVAAAPTSLRVDLESRSVAEEIAFGTTVTGETLWPSSFTVVPGRPSTLVVTRTADRRWEGTVVLDDGVARPEVLYAEIASVVAAWDGRVIYGVGTDGAVELSLHSRGLTIQRTVPELSLGLRPVLEGRLLFTSRATVVDPILLREIGRYEIGDRVPPYPFVPEEASHRTYAVVPQLGSPRNAYRVRVFDRERFVEVGYTDVPVVSWKTPISLVRWGPHGLAFLAIWPEGGRTGPREPSTHLAVITSDIIVETP